MQTSAHVLIPSPFSGRARACPVLDTGVGVKVRVKSDNCCHNHHLTPIPAFPLTWGRSFNSAVLIPSPFRGRAGLRVSVGVESKVEPNNCAYNHHSTPIPTFPLTWGRSFNSAVLIPSPFRGRARVGVKSNLTFTASTLAPFPFTWGKSFNHAK